MPQQQPSIEVSFPRGISLPQGLEAYANNHPLRTIQGVTCRRDIPFNAFILLRGVGWTLKFHKRGWAE